MTTYVLDASIAVKWAFPSVQEPLATEAKLLLKQYANGEFNIIVPDIFWAEVGNVFWKGARRGRWSRDDAERAVAEMQGRDFMTVSSLLLLPEALKIAFANDRGVYDCLYVALAAESRAELITADERLANALAARFPVKWLGAL